MQNSSAKWNAAIIRSVVTVKKTLSNPRTRSIGRAMNNAIMPVLNVGGRTLHGELSRE